MSNEGDEMTHISAELLERYSLHQLPEEQLAPLEEHLLVCAKCQKDLADADEFIGAMKLAAATLEQNKKQDSPHLQKIPRRPFQWALPLTGGLVVTALLSFQYWKAPAVEREQVTLIATRGGAETTIAHTSANSSLSIKAVIPDMEKGRPVRLELADSGGQIIWRQSVMADAGQVAAVIGHSLTAGTYWFRAYDGATLLQEYGLRID